MNQIALLPTAYFPNIAYLAVLANFQKVIIDTKEFYRKQTLRSRCVLLSPNGPLTLSVPVLLGRLKLNIPITQIQIDYSKNWITQHLNSIKTAYGSAPFFEFFFDQFVQILKRKEQKLFNLNLIILKQILSILDLNTQILTTSNLQNENIIDFRFLANKKLQFNFPKYPQVFEHKFGFVPNLCALDLLFNLGIEAVQYIKNIDLQSITNVKI